ncbi:GNAT family N-acetyltransferase [Ectobacillus ponti]|uniref:GNAT family N-acetyltransferase n=1 Tax=Ectobacillus ponti TaxID=2961894 RepID=A0AA41X8A7_9BACI|nr:GNAT family N-acetyltransferase [Ectobacillus ponti]MCP8968988.1 GNAT family N-acetyltransferase [Ectobacillus ponti]
MKHEEIQIRSLHKIEELEEVRQLESDIWGGEDSVPTHQTITAVKNGGLVLGAYAGERLVAFQYSFPGFNGTSVYLCSHILATDPAFRSRGIGEKLKWAQREEARKLGYSLITWTYDPLESINGYLNIAKLGGACSTYIENCYGEMEDLLNKGIASDRFLVEWRIAEEQTDRGPEIGLDVLLDQSLLRWERNGAGQPVPSAVLPVPEEKMVFVAVPKDYRTIRETDLEAAIQWRMATRQVFQDLFRQGWQVTDFKKNSQADVPVQFYVLSKQVR